MNSNHSKIVSLQSTGPDSNLVHFSPSHGAKANNPRELTALRTLDQLPESPFERLFKPILARSRFTMPFDICITTY